MNWNGLELPDKPYFQDDSVIIYNADCRSVLPLIPDKSIDLVLTDPPYGLNVLMQGGTWGIKFKHSDMQQLTSRWLGLILKSPASLGLSAEIMQRMAINTLRKNQYPFLSGAYYKRIILKLSAIHLWE